MDLRERPARLVARHPWETVRARFFAARCCELLACRPAPQRVLDVGAGDGFVAEALVAACGQQVAVTCYDADYRAEDLRELRARLPQLTFCDRRPDASFDLLLLLDVLEHVQDDAGFLRELCEHALRADGLVLLSVPAFMALYSRHDLQLGHYRRYQQAELAQTLSRAGLAPIEGGGLFGSLLLPRALVKLGELARGISAAPAALRPAAVVETALGSWHGGRLSTAAAEAALGLDARLSAAAAAHAIALPGLSLWVLARPRGGGRRSTSEDRA